MILPLTSLPKALFIIDVQPLTLEKTIAATLIPKIATFIRHTAYDAYIVAEYHAPLDSMMSKQCGFAYTAEETGSTDASIMTALAQKEFFRLHKTARSCFKSARNEELLLYLKEKNIGEIHFVGFDMNDCVLASAYEAIDLGYYSFVLEELSHNCDNDAAMVDAALAILRHQGMTNNSLEAKIPFRLQDDP